MDQTLIEISSGTVLTPDGESLQIQGGAYLPPAVYLHNQAELERLRHQQAEAAASRALPTMVAGFAILGFALGYWLARRGDDE
jgi:hypothetical protein